MQVCLLNFKIIILNQLFEEDILLIDNLFSSEYKENSYMNLSGEEEQELDVEKSYFQSQNNNEITYRIP
jgi:hypothetical protein